METFYLLSSKYSSTLHAPFALATTLALTELCGSRNRTGQVKQAILSLINDGHTLDGAEPAGYEIGQWKHRFMCDEEPEETIPDDAYFAWASTMFWDYEPAIVTYTKAEFMTLFEDCCRNFVALHPEWREELAVALIANGMSIEPTAERP